MSKDTHKRFKELSDEGDDCLSALRNIDKRVGLAFLHLKEASENNGDAGLLNLWSMQARERRRGGGGYDESV